MTPGPWRRGLLRDGLRLSFGTLSVLPVPAPQQVDRGAAAVAMTVAVLPGASLGAGAGLTLVTLAWLGVPALVAASGAVAASTLLSRFLHLDGLADTADGLVASFDRDRALAVMRQGDVGPAGAAVLVLVLLAQVGALASVAATVAADGPGAGRGATAVGLTVLAWSASRAVLPVITARGTRAARGAGLGATVLGSVPVPVAVAFPVALAILAWLSVGPRGLLAVGVAVLAAGALAAHAHRRLGGLTGDVLGGCVEVSLVAALTVLATA